MKLAFAITAVILNSFFIKHPAQIYFENHQYKLEFHNSEGGNYAESAMWCLDGDKSLKIRWQSADGFIHDNNEPFEILECYIITRSDDTIPEGISIVEVIKELEE